MEWSGTAQGMSLLETPKDHRCLKGKALITVDDLVFSRCNSKTVELPAGTFCKGEPSAICNEDCVIDIIQYEHYLPRILLPVAKDTTFTTMHQLNLCSSHGKAHPQPASLAS